MRPTPSLQVQRPHSKRNREAVLSLFKSISKRKSSFKFERHLSTIVNTFRDKEMQELRIKVIIKLSKNTSSIFFLSPLKMQDCQQASSPIYFLWRQRAIFISRRETRFDRIRAPLHILFGHHRSSDFFWAQWPNQRNVIIMKNNIFIETPSRCWKIQSLKRKIRSR